MLSRVLIGFILLTLGATAMAAPQPAVLFYTGWVHNTYVARPLVGMGIEVDACPGGKLAERLATGKYNVVVASTLDEADRKTLDDFLAKGGGVLVCNPEDAYSSKGWTGTNEWLTALGARPRWEVLQDSDNANIAVDPMGCRLSWSKQVSEPFNDGVRGVLTLTWGGTTGCEPPMSFELSPAWKPVVRGATSLRGVKEVRNDEQLQAWLPKELTGPAPALLAVREVGKGRLAVESIRCGWLFTPPYNCPTAEAMLTAGAAGKPSDWLRVFANTFRWLAAPSLDAGLGGATTPDAVLNPPVQKWDAPALWDWTKLPPLQDEPQTRGLIGARTALSSGAGSVADYVQAAKAAGLQYIVFLEDSLKMDQAKWDQLVKQCTDASDATFSAIPGLTYEDAQGDHLYAFSDDVRFPKPTMVLADGRLATTQSYRTRAYFDYVNELMQQHDIGGFWNHKKNWLIVADYKLYNSFPIYSFEDGVPIDDALPDYLYLQGIGGCQAALAFEFMTSPAQVAKRTADGWKVVCHRDVKDLRTVWYNGAWSFSGSGSQYITNGPSILAWDSPNRLCEPHGEWWRPDIWEYRVRLRVASEVGLKTVTVYDGDRQVLRRWQPTGAKRFEQEIIFANSQQLAPTLVVEDVNGHKAISMSFWNRNLNMEEFFCSDRCNFLGNCRLKTRAGNQTWTQVSFQPNMGITPSKGRLNMGAAPASNLTMNSPTLPIDGAPAGFPTESLDFGPHIPGELTMFAYPRTYMVGPEIAIGQSDYTLGYDPAEDKATTTPLGHPYDKQTELGGNAWSSWHHLVPARKATGWLRTAACNWLAEGFRIGWHEANLTAKETIDCGAKGIMVTYGRGSIYKNGQAVATPDMEKVQGPFTRGTIATLEDNGGAVVIVGDDNLTFDYSRGNFTIYYQPGKTTLAVGDPIRYHLAFAGASGGTTTAAMLDFARKFGVTTPGTPGYAAKVTHGKVLDSYLVWRLDAGGTAVTARIPKTAMPGFLPVSVEGLHDNWSVILLDKARKSPNTRALPIRDGRAYAQLDLVAADSDLFIGHPVTASNPKVTLQVCWQQPGVWSIEAHNPTDDAITADLATTPGWTPFTFKQTCTLPAGTSRRWVLAENK